MSPTNASFPARAAAFLHREAVTVGLFAVYCAVVLAALPQELVQDSWLTLVGGREVVEHGLPGHDRLTVWTLGSTWVDQQWGAQVVFYGLFLAGGVKLVMLAHAGVLATSFALGLVAARHRGASPKAVALVGAVTMFLAPWALQMRAQTLSMLLFVLVLWLLVADSRAPSRRVFLVLPLLVVWANVHGTVMLAVVLVMLRGLTAALEGARGRAPGPWKARSALLVGLAPACLLASPYGFELVGYYRQLLLNPMLHSLIEEWGASEPSQKTALFYLLAFATVWLVARHGSRLTLFERACLLVTVLSGVTAIRSIVWFALTALVILPTALDATLTAPRPSRFGTLRVAGAAAALVAVVAFAASAVARPESWYVREWPNRASPAIAAATRDPATLVLSDDRHADWILWEHPHLVGRVAYDVRFELFADDQLRQLFAYRNQVGDDWRRAGMGYDVVALDASQTGRLVKTLLAEDGLAVAYRDARIAILRRDSKLANDGALTNASGARAGGLAVGISR
jgi:hypothetical protein